MLLRHVGVRRVRLNIAEDQVFALNPELGVAYMLRHAGGNSWQESMTLSNLPLGSHAWCFFVVDHQWNTSNIVALNCTVR
jgi:hypothetical protein